MTRIKICGITNLTDALTVVELGADAIGFVFAESPREITVDRALEISLALPPFVSRVGVFVNETEETIESVFHSCKLTEAQVCSIGANNNLALSLSTPHLPVLRVKDARVLEQIRERQLDRFVLDAYDPDRAGGTGKRFDWSIAAQASRMGKLILSGGLTPENVADALQTVRPYAVDVSSGVETEPGVKDYAKLKAFIQEVRKWDYQTN